MRIIIATIKSWNIRHAQALQKQYEGVHEIVIYTTKEEFTEDNVRDFGWITFCCRTGLYYAAGNF